MDYVTYLLKVVTEWEAFCKQHPKTKEAIIAVLLENQALKLENEKLKNKK